MPTRLATAGRRVALATSQVSPPPGDLALADALRRRGAHPTLPVWSAAGLDWSAFDVVVIRSCWDYHLRLDEFLAWLAAVDAASVRVVNAPDLVRWNARKTYLQELATRDIAVPDTEWLDDHDEVEVAALCAGRGWPEAVVKPVVSASAHGTERRTTGQVRGPALVQRFVPAVESEGEWSSIYLGGCHSHDVRKRPRRADFRVQAEYGGTVEILPAPRTVRAFSDRVLAALPSMPSLARVDVVQDGARPLLMEVEVIEPELYLDLVPGAADRAAAVILTVAGADCAV